VHLFFVALDDVGEVHRGIARAGLAFHTRLLHERPGPILGKKGLKDGALDIASVLDSSVPWAGSSVGSVVIGR